MAETEQQEQVATTVAVEIFGVSYTLREDGEVDADRIRRLAERVDRKMREVADQAPNLDSGRVAVLAALNLASESSSDDRPEDERYRDLVDRVSILAAELEAAVDA